MNGKDLIRIKIFCEVVILLRNNEKCDFGAVNPKDYSKMYIKYNEKYYYFTDPLSENSYRAIYESINLAELSNEYYLIKIKELSYKLAIRSPVNTESKKSLYLDIYDDVKKIIIAEEEAKKVVEEEKKVEEVYDEDVAKKIIDTVKTEEEHGEKAQLIIKNALKNFLNVAEILKKYNLIYNNILNVNIVYYIITYKNINYKIDKRDFPTYEEIVQLLNTTKDYLDSGQTLGKQDALSITEQVRELKTISKSTIPVGLYDAVLADVETPKSIEGGKRISKGKSNKVTKKPIVSQKKQSIYKEIFGKQMKIYKMPDSRKEYVRYKGELHPISEYKSLMKQKALAKPKPKPKPKK
jgi:hypothetical protein